MTTTEILRAARAKIDTPDKWYGGRDNPAGLGACALVAFREWAPWHPAATNPQSACRAAVDTLARVMGVTSIPVFNNSHTHAEVLAAFDRAIAVEEAREQEFVVGDNIGPEPIREPVAA